MEQINDTFGDPNPGLLLDWLGHDHRGGILGCLQGRPLDSNGVWRFYTGFLESISNLYDPRNSSGYDGGLGDVLGGSARSQWHARAFDGCLWIAPTGTPTADADPSRHKRGKSAGGMLQPCAQHGPASARAAVQKCHDRLADGINESCGAQKTAR